jgi:hypothetical protein
MNFLLCLILALPLVSFADSSLSSDQATMHTVVATSSALTYGASKVITVRSYGLYLSSKVKIDMSDTEFVNRIIHNSIGKNTEYFSPGKNLNQKPINFKEYNRIANLKTMNQIEKAPLLRAELTKQINEGRSFYGVLITNTDTHRAIKFTEKAGKIGLLGTVISAAGIMTKNKISSNKSIERLNNSERASGKDLESSGSSDVTPTYSASNQ